MCLFQPLHRGADSVGVITVTNDRTQINCKGAEDTCIIQFNYRNFHAVMQQPRLLRCKAIACQCFLALSLAILNSECASALIVQMVSESA